MIIEEFADGLAFMSDDAEYEIAFYNRFTDQIRYNENNGYLGVYTTGAICIPYEDNRKIVDEVRRYKRALECKIE